LSVSVGLDRDLLSPLLNRDRYNVHGVEHISENHPELPLYVSCMLEAV
jgi:hypothetical protein